jgi:hypothetical protein
MIIHFQPLEMYPPVMNFVSLLAGRGMQVEIVSTVCTVSEYEVFDPRDNNIRIRRYGAFRVNMNVFSKVLNYSIFYLRSFINAVWIKPHKILYYETLSALPVYYYKRYFNRSVDVLIHYHEYTSPGEYLNGMALVKRIHSNEKFLYKNCSWISHTNNERMERFLEDEKISDRQVAKVWPNYPPASWSRSSSKFIGIPVRFVYVGALSFDTMYIAEFVQWISLAGNGSTLDIYTTNMPESSRKKLAELGGSNVRLMGGVDYEEIPSVLSSYDIGLVLYKGHIPNYVYNAPNKLFEYLTCGLDVWFPSVMVGCKKFITDKVYPKVVEVDFERLDCLELESMISREGFKFEPSPFTAEKACAEVLTELEKKNVK